MKKIICLMLCVLTALSLCACKEEPTIYTAEKLDFYYRIEHVDSEYGNMRYEMPVDKEVSMKIKVYFTTNKAKEEVRGSLTLPKINAVDAYYIKGTKITPVVDDINNTTTYPFVISTNEEWEFTFVFVPNSVAVVQMTLDFEEPIPDMYDKISTIKFVESVSEE